MIKKFILGTVISLGLTASIQAEEKPKISMSTASYQLMAVKDKKGKIIKDKKGKPVKKWVKAAKVVPGTVIKYVDTITNDSDEALKDAKVSNPINQNLLFVADSAKLNGVRPADDSSATADKSSEVRPHISVKYSVDGGKSYAIPGKLFVKDKKGNTVQAEPKHYNAILFTVDEVPAHSKVDVSFKVKLK